MKTFFKKTPLTNDRRCERLKCDVKQNAEINTLRSNSEKKLRHTIYAHVNIIIVVV